MSKEKMIRPIKPYADVKVGDSVYNNPCPSEVGDYEGKVVWKGTVDELMTSQYHWTLDDDWGDGEIDPVEMARDYDLVLVSTEDGLILFNYNNDPCGVVALGWGECTIEKSLPDEEIIDDSNKE